ncbi:nuclear transport factor 2 family protein [Shewanella fidelis]|uniref:nuclear transport factor 2 family protein n=1 Tax=Shewanella fidelis TaxID=173509 RepID=UPI0004B1EA0B|nr:nuclear transport factor 2 family protein [Shewanella fidelis]
MMKDSDINQQRKTIIEDYIHAYNSLDPERMLEHLHDEIVYTNSFLDSIDTHALGKAAFKSQAESIICDFVARRMTIVAWTFSSSKVIVDIEYDVILNSVDTPALDEQFIDMKGFIEFWFRGGKIAYINSFV